MTRRAAVRLQPATLQDRNTIYMWLCYSDVTQRLMGPPHFPEASIPSWSDFKQSYAECFFDDSNAALTRSYLIYLGHLPIGHICYDGRHMPKGAFELRIWLKSRDCCGHGYGSAAMQQLLNQMTLRHATDLFAVTSHRNEAALKAYQKLGFEISHEAIFESPLPRYHDRVWLHKTLVMEQLA